MKYASVVLLVSSLLSAASAITYVKPQDVNPDHNYALTMERDGKTFALESTPKNTTGTKEIKPDLAADVGDQNNLRWKFPYGISMEGTDNKGYLFSVAGQNFLGWKSYAPPEDRISTDISQYPYYPLGGVKAESDDSIKVHIFGENIGYEGKKEPGTTWKISLTTGKWGARRRAIPRRMAVNA